MPPGSSSVETVLKFVELNLGILLWNPFSYWQDNMGYILYLWDTSPVVTVDDVDNTFFPAASTASQILPVFIKRKKWNAKVV